MKYDANILKSTVPPPRWQDLVKPYQQAENRRAVWQVVNTILPLGATYYFMYRSLSWHYGVTILLTLVAAGLSIRTFIIQHDCGHGSFFSSQKANDFVGTICGFLSLIPYYQWRHEHAIHHATSGNLARRGVGDVTTLTVREYLALTRWQRFSYAIYRQPLVMLLIGPTFIFGIMSRVVGPHSGKREKFNVHLTTGMVLAQLGGWSWVIGWQTVLLLWAPVFLIAGAAGIWLFYVQHQYENTYWRTPEEWDYSPSALEGSSYYRLPRLLQWFTGNIGFHHIHHLSPRIPNYRLEECHDQTPLFQKVTTFGIRESLRCARLRLWDEENRRMVGFDYARSLSPRSPEVTA